MTWKKGASTKGMEKSCINQGASRKREWKKNQVS
jgi:hypothetical protein